MNATQRKNLLKLAAYLESLPRNYQHFDMGRFARHYGDCELPMPEQLYAAKEPLAFLSNCGTAACAVGHGPAAGIPPIGRELGDDWFDWDGYTERAFGVVGDDFEFLFGGSWNMYDNHHFGAAARIRYFLESGDAETGYEEAPKKYAPYRKGSRSEKRREIEAAL